MGQPPAAPWRRKLCSVANPTSSKLRQERHGACLKTPWGHAARDFGRAQHPPARLRFTNLQSAIGRFCILPSSFCLPARRPPELRPQRLPRRLPPEGGEPGTPPSGGRWIAQPRQPPDTPEPRRLALISVLRAPVRRTPQELRRLRPVNLKNRVGNEKGSVPPF